MILVNFVFVESERGNIHKNRFIQIHLLCCFSLSLRHVVVQALYHLSPQILPKGCFHYTLYDDMILLEFVLYFFSLCLWYNISILCAYFRLHKHECFLSEENVWIWCPSFGRNNCIREHHPYVFFPVPLQS